MQIGGKTIAAMKGMAAEHIDTYAKKIDEAFRKSEDGKIKVSLTFDIGISERGGLDVDATISFTADRVKDKVSKTIIENQAELALERMRPEKGSGIESVTLSSGGKSVTLAQAE